MDEEQYRSIRISLNVILMALGAIIGMLVTRSYLS